MTADFTLEQLLGELEREREGDDAGATTTELCAATGWSSRKVIAGLRRLWLAGRLATGRKWVERIDGIRTKVPTYWLKAST